MNTEDKYNKLIHETNTLQKFEVLYMKMLSDDYLDMSEIFTLMKIIERDAILVHKLPEVSALMDMTETFVKYMIIKDDERSKKKKKNKKEKKNKIQQISRRRRSLSKIHPKNRKSRTTQQSQPKNQENVCVSVLPQQHQKKDI